MVILASFLTSTVLNFGVLSLVGLSPHLISQGSKARAHTSPPAFNFQFFIYPRQAAAAKEKKNK